MQMHKLAGSARTFGFAELNRHAAAVEALLDRIIDHPPAARDTLQAAGAALHGFLAEARQITAGHLHPSAPAAAPEAADPPAGTEFDFNILLADDDDLVRDLLRDGLSEARCAITEAASGTEALALLDRIRDGSGPGRPDLIILDVNMPGVSGFEVLRRLKADPAFQDIPVIMLTRRDEDSNILDGISAGAWDYITKPFDVGDLVARIATTLERRRTKVLIADDDELICDLLRHRFRRMGFAVTQVHSGTEALARIRSERPDISILDVMMPGMEGSAVLKQLQAAPDTADLPVVFLTAKNQQDNIIKGLESGAHDYITKPFDLDEVSARVSGILRRRKTG